MRLEHRPAVAETFVLDIDTQWPWYAHIQKEVVRGTWSSYELADDVQAWLDEHAPGTEAVCDQGDWGEGTPIWEFHFSTEDRAKAFWAVFGRPEEDDRLHRTSALWSGLHPALVTPEGELKEPVLTWLASKETKPEVSTKRGPSGDVFGTSVHFVFETRELAEEFNRALLGPLRSRYD